ncbi:MFS general substrate transporter [Auricularia subglabra TFB-10046 SS5]|nr:MFS general substrate transporter [Auricularia subglabra TFB-10046 SS5]
MSQPTSALPHHADGVPNVDAELAVDAAANYLDYPEREPFIRQLSRDNAGASLSRASSRKRKPWWKRPSIYWVLPLGAFRQLCIIMGAAPQIEILTRMACQVHRPDLAIEHVRFPDWRDDPPPNTSVPPGPLPPIMPWSAAHVAQGFVEVYGLGDIFTGGNSTKKPTRGALCAKDPEVQKGTAWVITIAGVLAGLTTTLTSACDSNMILVTYFSAQLPGKAYWWIIPGTMFVGLLGGGYGGGALAAYLSDCTEPTNRAAVFAINAGIAMGGVALAPLIGAQLVRHSGDLLSPFYLSVLTNLIALLLWLFVVPESLPRDVRAANAKKLEEERERSLPDPGQGWGWVLRWIQPLIDLIRPLKAFIPHWRDEGDHSTGKDWNLTVLGIVYTIIAISTAAIAYFMQIAQNLWSWDNEMIGYWLSLIGLSRAVYLLVIFPVIIRLFKPKPHPVALEGPEDQLHPETAQPAPAASDPETETEVEEELPKSTATPSFDLVIIRVSLLADAAMYVCIFLSATPLQWMLGTMGLAMGGSLFPSLMSLALAVSPGGAAEAGSLFGGFQVLLSLGGEVCGQLVFGSLFRLTVAVFPRAIIIITAVVITAALVITFFIRLPKATPRGRSV